MPKRTPTITRITETFEVKAKRLVKGDPIWVGKRVFTVKSNETDGDHRTLHLVWGSNNASDEAFLTVPKNLVFSVNKHTVRKGK